MRKITAKKLPHGTIPFAQVHDATLRDALMKINENVRSLGEQLKAAVAAIRELQRRS